MSDKDPQQCFDFIRDGGWTWFITLRYPPRAEHEVELGTARDCFADWMDWLTHNFAQDAGVSYVFAVEPRDDGERLIHLLLRDVPEESREPWRMQWGVRTGSYTNDHCWDRNLNEGVEGLFRHFYFQKRFKIVEKRSWGESDYLYNATDDEIDDQYWG